MRIVLGATLAAFALIAGCSGSRNVPKAESPKRFTAKELGASFRVPASWSEAKKPWIGTPPYVARFEAPSDDVAVVLGRAPFEGDCVAAARAALRAAAQAALSSEHRFTLATPRGDLPAGQGRTSGEDREGIARFFCFGPTAVVLDASAPKSAFNRRQRELETIVDTLAFDAGGEEVAIRAPAAPPSPPSYFIHVVKFGGQTLGRLAEWYTGAYENWPKLARANGEPVPNSPLSIGREIKIPSELVVRQDPLPEPPRRRRSTRAAEPKGESSTESGSTAPSSEGDVPLPPVIGPR